MRIDTENPRKYGKKPFNVAVLHGGPGARGEMAPVARELASVRGVLEPLEEAASLEGQVEELKTTLIRNADLPVVLIGFSWGAWLGYVLAARHPSLIKKLILVGSGPFEEKYARGIDGGRMRRLNTEERAKVRSLQAALENPAGKGKDAALTRLGFIFSKADAYDPLPTDPAESEALDCRFGIFDGAWRDGAEWRRSGRLIELGHRIRCPVVAVHGDADPHPAEGVEKPLSAVLEDFRFILVRDCGHKPWIERRAREEFYKITKKELI
jgi:pimeloyl-ACP methyl ester carboxylesterase